MALDNGQITHPICVRLKIRFMICSLVGRGSGFAGFSSSFPFLYLHIHLYIYRYMYTHFIFNIPCAISTGKVQNHQKTPYDSEEG